METGKGISLVFGMGFSRYLYNISGTFKNKGAVLHSGTLLQTPDLVNFATAYRSSKRDQVSSRKVMLNDRCLSTKLIIHASSDARPL